MRSDVFRIVAEGTARELGQDFVRAMVRSLKEAMEVSIALVTVGVGHPISRARPIHYWRADGTDLVEYDLAEVPCARVYEGEEVIVPADLCMRYPREFPFHGYVGVPLRNALKEVVGHVAVLSETPIADPDLCTNVLRIFGGRAEAELMRRESDAERERLIEALTRTNSRLDRQAMSAKRANAVKAQLLGMAAHDLRSPIGAIITRAETAESYIARGDAPSLERAVACCEEAIKSAERIEGMIRKLLDAARQDSDELPFAPHRMNIVACVRSALALNADHARAKRIACELDAPSETIELDADEDLLLEAIDNLISNAIKFSWPGSRVDVVITSDENRVHIEVRDQGQGLTPDDVTRAFGRFQRLSAKPTEGEDSIGLGLHIVRAIAERHGGRATVESDGPGKGARFTLTLPRSVG